MFPEEIKKILLDNENLIAEEISEINICINKIKSSLKSASDAMMGEVALYAKNTELSNQDKEIELHQASLKLRRFIADLSIIQQTMEKDISIIDIHDVIVLSNTRKCSTENHHCIDVQIEIPVVKGGGGIECCNLLASYCPTCKRYTILKEQFQNIDGIVMCRVIDETTHYSNTNKGENDFENAQRQSIVFQYGYNVQSKINLTTQQRHIILASIVEAKIQTRRQIIDHLTTLIERGEKIKKWKDATNKWKEDRYYVESYNVQNLPSVIGERIILKYKYSS